MYCGTLYCIVFHTKWSFSIGLTNVLENCKPNPKTQCVSLRLARETLNILRPIETSTGYSKISKANSKLSEAHSILFEANSKLFDADMKLSQTNLQLSQVDLQLFWVDLQLS